MCKSLTKKDIAFLLTSEVEIRKSEGREGGMRLEIA